ncbi:MAG: lipoyl synthase [Planctomycetota bacterium]
MSLENNSLSLHSSDPSSFRQEWGIPVEPFSKKPNWLKRKLPSSENFAKLEHLIREKSLHTVCESAKCPNIWECWDRGTATFMILGDICTRSCGFCAVKTGRPTGLDLEEPKRVAEAVQKMKIRHAVVTSVNRDELADGGAEIFYQTILEIRALCPGVTIEVLTPDFRGNWSALQKVISAKPEILNHNTETVPRLYPRVRPQARYGRSLEFLERARKAGMLTKSGIMLGLGETLSEVEATLKDLRCVDLQILTMGQYLQPTLEHLPIVRYITPDEFAMLKDYAQMLGFKRVESAPLVRSSYHAEEGLC